MPITSQIRQFFRTLTIQERKMLTVIISLFLPYQISIVVLSVNALTEICTGALFRNLKEIPYAKSLFSFAVITTAVALLYKNYLGAICGVASVFIVIFILECKQHMTKEFFEYAVDFILILSWLCFVFSIFEFYFKNQTMIDKNPLLFLSKISNMKRVNSFFSNANYYATIIEFVAILSVYKLISLSDKSKRWIYYTTLLVNALALYMTGCRTAWLVLAMAFPIMFLLSRKYTLFKLSLLIFFIGAVALIVHPTLLPRFDRVEANFKLRMEIWTCALNHIKDHPLFGQGPMSFYFLGDVIHNKIRLHAHNMYIEMILSFGMIPTYLLIRYLINECANARKHYYETFDATSIALLVGVAFAVLVHGVVDYTIFWVQSAPLFFIIVASASAKAESETEVLSNA